MKRLTIIRHGKSSWSYNVGDMERPLKKRGIADVKAVSREYNGLGISPEAVFSSPAKRAYTTCDIFLKNSEFSYIIPSISSQLYDFSGNNLINFIKSIDNNYTNVMIFGHNHALTYFTNTYGDINIDNLPTSGVAVFEFDINDWKDLKPGKTFKILIPKNLRD